MLTQGNFPIRLNVHEQVKHTTVNAFTSHSSKDKRPGEWPFILQPPLKPKRYKRKNALPEKTLQTEQKYLSSKKQTKKNLKNDTFLWKPPEEEIPVEAQSSVSIQSSTSTKPMINMDVLCKKIESKSRISESNTLPKYVLKEPLTSVPNWVERNLPEYIKPETIIQAGKPWHKSDECSWTIDVKNLSSMQPATRYFTKKDSPNVYWGISACSLQKKKFNIEYGKARKKKKKIKKDLSIHRKLSDKDKSCKADFYRNIIKKKVLQPIFLPIDPSLAQSVSSPETIGNITPPLCLTRGLYGLSYEKKDDRKKKYPTPNIYGIEKPWKFLTERKWSSDIATTTLFSSLARAKVETSTIDASKYPVYGQWPYADNMVKTTNTTTAGTFKTKTNYSLDNSSSNRSKLEYIATRKYDKQKKTSSIIIPPIMNSIKKFDDFFNYKQQGKITEIAQKAETIPSTINRQKLFPGFIETQGASIKPLIYDAPFTYQLSNLHLYESNYTYLMKENTYLRTLIYYSTFNNRVTRDPFQVITTKRYLNKIPYLNVPSTGSAAIYYPSGKVAIQCAYSSIENKPDLLTRRYTIKNELTQRVQAVFDSLGNGIVYDNKGNIIFNYSQNFGVRIQNNRLSKWRWHNIPVTDEVYSEEIESLQNPPSNIPNNEIEEMVLRNVNIYDRYLQSIPENRSVESNLSFPEHNPVAYKTNGDINYGVITQLKPFILKINEYLKLYVRDQKHMKLKFQANEVKLTLQLGVLLNPKIILERETIDYDFIPHEKIICKFDKIVGETESLIEILKKVGDGKKLDPLKYKTPLIDFNDKVKNLLDGESFDYKPLKKGDIYQSLSDHTLRVKNKNIKPIINTKISQKERITQDSNKFKDGDNSLIQSEEEKLSENKISKFYHLDNLLDGSNPIASNVSFLIKNKPKLKQFLYESKYRK